MQFHILYQGDHSLLLQFENAISPSIYQAVIATKKAIAQQNISGIVEMIPTYNALLIDFNPSLIAPTQLASLCEKISVMSDASVAVEKIIFEIPVCYEEPFCLDLETVAKHANIIPDAVIALHAAPFYFIYMLGFVAGFPYLGGLDEKIATPRLQQPRNQIQAGSVGIAGKQTGIYPINSPGGWQIIGRTPLDLFDITKTPPVLLQAGAFLRFVPICKDNFFLIKEQIKNKQYQPVIKKEIV